MTALPGPKQKGQPGDSGLPFLFPGRESTPPARTHRGGEICLCPVAGNAPARSSATNFCRGLHGESRSVPRLTYLIRIGLVLHLTNAEGAGKLPHDISKKC
jgi:hypothetical protein